MEQVDRIEKSQLEREEEIREIEEVLASLRKHRKLSEKKYALMEKGYQMTDKAVDNASMEYETEPEYRAICLELDKLSWAEKLRQLDQNIRKTERLLEAKKRVMEKNDE